MAETSFQTYSFQDFAAEPEELPLPVQVLGTGRERRTESSYRWDNDRHRRRRFHVLQYTLSGRGEFRWGRSGGGEQTRVVGPGELFVASWDQQFEYRHPGDGEAWEFLWIILEGPLADEILARVTRPGPVVGLGPGAAPILLLENLLRRLEQRGTWDRYALSVVGYELCLFLVKAGESAALTTGDEVGRLAEAWVLGHLATADCPSMAAHFGYNGKYFAEYLHRHTGLSPQKFIQDRKMRYACLVLTGTAKTVASLSAELGFAEDNYFSKVFRRHMGQSPQAYRLSHQDSLVYDEVVAL